MGGKKTPEQLARGKYADWMRNRGTPLMVTPDEMALMRRHLKSLHDAGMSYQNIADAAPGNHSETSVSKVLRNWTVSMHRDVYNDLMQAQFELPRTPKHGRSTSDVGMKRRMRALACAGFGYHMLGRELGISGQAAYQLTNSGRAVRTSSAVRVAAVYDKLQWADPYDFGGTRQGVGRAKGVAARNDWAPAHCWDEDTIDDPEAYPEWTGACGTQQGYRLHHRYEIGVKVPALPSAAPAPPAPGVVSAVGLMAAPRVRRLLDNRIPRRFIRYMCMGSDRPDRTWQPQQAPDRRDDADRQLSCENCQKAVYIMNRFPCLGYMMELAEEDARGKYGHHATKHGPVEDWE